MQTHRWMLSLITVVLLAGMTWAAQPGPAANWGQAEVSGWNCPITYFPPTPLLFSEMPISVSLTTEGPVLLSVSLTTDSISDNAEPHVIFSVDGAAISAPLMHWTGPRPQEGSLTRIVTVPAGTHTFGVQIACRTSGYPLSGGEAQQEGTPVYVRHTVMKGTLDDEAPSTSLAPRR